MNNIENKVDRVKQKTSAKILQIFSNIDVLKDLCSTEAFITNDSSLKMTFGMYVCKPKEDHSFINGTYGIRKVDTKTGEELAVCGFHIQGNQMIIEHTPQGNRPEEFSSEQVRHRFGRSDFRIEMMQAMIDIAKQLRLEEVIGYPITPYFIGDKEVYLKKIKAKDHMFELFNFSLIDKGSLYIPYYYLPLNPNS